MADWMSERREERMGRNGRRSCSARAGCDGNERKDRSWILSLKKKPVRFAGS